MSSIPSIISYYKAPLPSGNTYHLVNPTTGADIPDTIAPGYEYDIIGYWLSFSQLMELNLYYNNILTSNAFINPNQWIYEHNIAEFQSKELDPNHLGFTFDVTGTNRGSAVSQGYGTVYGVLRKV